MIYKKLHWLSLLIGFLSIVIPIIYWKQIPEQIPMHYNAAGLADRWGDKSTLILLFFVIVLLMGMMSIVVFIVKTNMQSRFSETQEKSVMSITYKMLIIMNLIMQLMFAYIVFCCATGRSMGVLFLPVFLIGIFLPLGYTIIKSRKIRLQSEMEKAYFKKLEKEEAGTVYRSAIDWWLGLLLVGTEFMMLWFFIEPIIHNGKISIGMILTTVAVTIMLCPLFTIKYVLYSSHIWVSMGFYGSIRIGYADVMSLKKTSNPLSSAAMSLKRIQIDYVEKGVHQMVLISPKNREQFIEEVKKRKENH